MLSKVSQKHEAKRVLMARNRGSVTVISFEQGAEKTSYSP